MSGPGATVRSAEAARKSPISGMDLCRANKKAPYGYGALLPKRNEPSGLRRRRLDRDGALPRRAVDVVLHLAVGHREERVVLADADVAAGVEAGAALADQDGARVHLLAAVGLEAEALAFGIAAVAGRPACFLAVSYTHL